MVTAGGFPQQGRSLLHTQGMPGLRCTVVGVWVAWSEAAAALGAADVNNETGPASRALVTHLLWVEPHLGSPTRRHRWPWSPA